MQVTINDEKLAEIIRLYNDFDPTAGDETIKNAILHDWEDEEDHQNWLDIAEPKEIAEWVASFVFDDGFDWNPDDLLE